MAKRIFATDEDVASAINKVNSIAEMLENDLKKKMFHSSEQRDIKLSISIDVAEDDRKATLIFTKKAYIKMYALVNKFTTEVEWHGTVRRINENSFEVTDVLIFPHEARATTVTSNQEEYNEWLDSLDDETFDSLRFHGHSHVDMPVSPSSTDNTYRRCVLNNFGIPTSNTDFFYIFLIANKKGNMNVEIYDLQNNASYSNDEIDLIMQLDDDEYLSEFLAEAESVVKTSVHYSQNKISWLQNNDDAKPAATNSKRHKGLNKPISEQIEMEDYDYEDMYNGYYGGGCK